MGYVIAEASTDQGREHPVKHTSGRFSVKVKAITYERQGRQSSGETELELLRH
ncbi:hypothetical protein K0M31_018964 [Melipona bicolor]|uniref:Uncharacterized protein n=1 Tax=Melipona bicolor TaxID=60889 RepID=A0AA40FCL6_9HYME|nr:hypothetical protein K0M31_018964 [Melipona bicolor]